MYSILNFLETVKNFKFALIYNHHDLFQAKKVRTKIREERVRISENLKKQIGLRISNNSIINILLL